MSSQDFSSKDIQGKSLDKNIPDTSHPTTQNPLQHKKEKLKSRYRKRRTLRLCRKKGTAHPRYSLKKLRELGLVAPSETEVKNAPQLEAENSILNKEAPGDVVEENILESGNDVDSSKKTKYEDYAPVVNVVQSEEIEDPCVELEVQAEVMEVSSQSGDQKNKLLEMMSREFNSGTIQEGTITLESRKSPRVPRQTRKRKIEVADTTEKTADITPSQQSPITIVTPVIHNPITSALKKIRKENLENVSQPSSPAPTPPTRTRRSTQERKSVSEKDSNEELLRISEIPDLTETKTTAETKPLEEGLSTDKNTPDTRWKKRGRGRGRSFVEGEEGNDSGNESPVIAVKGRGKTISGSEEDSFFGSLDSAGPSKSRVRNTKGLLEIESAGVALPGKGKGKVSPPKEESVEMKGRGKQKVENEKVEEQLDTGKDLTKLKSLCEDSGNIIPTNCPAVTKSTRSKGKGETEKETTLEIEPMTHPRRSLTPVSGESIPQSEVKRSQRILLSREGSTDPPPPPPVCKRGSQKLPEVIKKPEIITPPLPPVKPPPPKIKKEEVAFTKTGKKKKKHFKGLSYSFKTKKKKGKTKVSQGRQILDTSQESDSVVSEEIDMESVDSSSQDVPSELLSSQDQDGVDDRLSDGGENDVEMDNNRSPNLLVNDDGIPDSSPEKVFAKPPDSEETLRSPEKIESEVTGKEENLDKVTEEPVSKYVKSELHIEKEDNLELSNEVEMKDNVSNDNDVGPKVSPLSVEDTVKVQDSTIETVNCVPVKIYEEEDKSKVKDSIETELKTVSKPNQPEALGKGLRIKRPPPGLSIFSSSCAKEVTPVVIQKQVKEKEFSSLPSKMPNTPEMSSSASESAFSPEAELEVQVPDGGGEALEKRPDEAASLKCDKDHGNQSGNKDENSQQMAKVSNKSQVIDPPHTLSQLIREPLPFQDEGLRQLSRRRQSISKKKMEDFVPEAHNSDSSDSLGEPKLSCEGVRKSKRLSRHSSPHGPSFAAPESPEGPGRSQSKPISSQSAHVTPASPGGEHHCYSILSPPVNLTHSSHLQGNLIPAAPTLTNVLCKCRIKYNPLAVGITDDVYCQAIDSFDGRMIGCCNIVTNNRLLRVSGKIPFMLLCDSHRQRLRRHNCCPCCGLFCTQGVFYECTWDKRGLRHYYHKLCSLLLNGENLCPHCGSAEIPQEVQLELTVARKPVVYLKQHQERKELSARMTWSKGDSAENAREEVTAENAPTLELRNGKVISAQKLPFGCGREKLQEAIIYINDGKSTITAKSSSKGIYNACKQNDLEKLLQALISGTSPNIKVKECGNQTGLHVAAAFGSVAALHILVMAGATIDMTDNQLMTPLMIAIIKEQNDVVFYLVQTGASLMAKTQDGMTCLHLAAKCGNLTACKHILDSGRLTRHAINMQDEGGWTPLVWASENKFSNVVKFLLDRGGNPQLCDVEQNTALHWAAFSGSTDICCMVLDRGCSLRSMNAHGDTPLHIAARQNHTDAVVLLLTRGAQLDVVNAKNQTPVECALPDSDVYLQLTLNSKVLEIMKQNNIRTEKILSSDIAGGKEEVPIPCVNGVDEDQLPKDYLYIAENCEASNVNVDRTITSLKWCECEDGCNAEHCGCGQLNFQCWFDPDGRLLPEFNYADPPMIFECNRACRCNKLSCNNRVVQHGISAHMQLFKTVGKGWGVRALKTIQKGSYVCEYVGEIITDLEADQRQDDSYLFDLDNRDSETFCIDARSYGNIARFINHLCEANLTPVKVFIDHQDLTFPRIALFANRDIEADEELGFDYGEKFWMIKYKQFTCTCSSEKCKYSSETIHTTLENYNRRLRELQETL